MPAPIERPSYLDALHNHTTRKDAMSTYITADTIRTLREQQGLTQRALAEAVGVTDKAVSKWESGRAI